MAGSGLVVREAFGVTRVATLAHFCSLRDGGIACSGRDYFQHASMGLGLLTLL